MIWAALHIALNGDKASIIFFGTFLVLSALGTLSIDEKRKKALGEQWESFAQATSNLPFAAIIDGRNRLAVSKLGWLRILLGLIPFGAMFFAPFWLFVLPPDPGWAP